METIVSKGILYMTGLTNQTSKEMTERYIQAMASLTACLRSKICLSLPSSDFL